MKKLVLFTLIFLFIFLKQADAGIYYISNCTTLKQSDSIYYLTQDIIGIPEDRWMEGCIQIYPNSNITLDCQGHVIECDRYNYYWQIGSNYVATVPYCGIKVNYGLANPFIEYCPDSYSNNNTIKNCVVKNCGIGIGLFNSDNNFITNVTAIDNPTNIFLYCGSSFNILDNVYTQNANSYEISFYWGGNSNNTVRNSKILATHTPSYSYPYWFPCAFLIDGSHFNNFYNNFISADICYVRWHSPLVGGTYFNTTKKLGTNIVNGKMIGGNYWTNSNKTGYSDTCDDTDNDGFCDVPFSLGIGNSDFLPLKPTPTLPTLCKICDVSVIPTGIEYYPIKFLCLFFNLLCNPIFSFLLLGLILFSLILLKMMR
jgi:parallel beta-helix repeat protein